MDTARFTRAEVNEFRDVFSAWVERSGSSSSPSSARGTVQRSSLGSMRGAKGNTVTLEAMMDKDNEALLPISSLNLLLASISVNISLEENRNLKQKAFEI